MKVILPLSIPIMIFLLSLFLISCSSSNAPEISTFATTDSSLDPKFSPDNNIFLECDTSGYKFERYNCYKDVSLYAMQHGANVEQLFEFISENNIDHHLKKHSIGRAALIVSDYNLSLAKEKCMPQNCVEPYYHAIAEEWAEYAPSKVTEYIDFLNSFCPLENPKDFGCWHHAGHFYQSLNKNFKENIVLCNDLKHHATFSGCITGIIHEKVIQSGFRTMIKRNISTYRIPRASEDDALHHAAEEARADLIQVPGGYSLTTTINYMEGADIESTKKPGIRTQTKYVKKDNSRVDTLFKNKEKRHYRIREGNSLTEHECNKENEKWVCDKVDSILWTPEDIGEGDLGTIAEWVQEQLGGTSVEQTADRKIAGIKAKCFSYPDGSINCYHPTAPILLYQETAGFTKEVTSLDLNVPDDELFVLP